MQAAGSSCRMDSAGGIRVSGLMGGLEGAWDVRLAGVDRAKVAKEPRVKRVERMCMVEEKGWFGMWNWFCFSIVLCAWKNRLLISPPSHRRPPSSSRKVMSSSSHHPSV